METRKLYYEDCHLRQFTATVTACEKAENGWYISLDQTVFYPEGGGQACDLGTLDDAAVLDVQEQGETVVHLCDRPFSVGQTVTGSIDWQRRFDLMQQHTGEHLLSGLIHDQFGYHNSGFHVGAQVMEVDFDGPIPADALWELEYRANALVWANLPVNCYYPSREELPNVQYRTKRELPWPVRIVDIPGADTCACCGVHVKYTGEVGLIKIRLYRPFPADEIADALKNVKAVAIMDRAEGYTNHGGPLGADVMSALFRARSNAFAVNYVYGLGGRDVRVEDMENVFADLQKVINDGDAGEMYRYMGIRE